MSKKVRTRFAPSPTGDPHIGSIWMALFQWLHARVNGGTFILRLDDTDQKRTQKGTEKKILEALRWYGINYDEGPDIGGEYGPYRQSERLPIYKKYAEILLKQKSAYYCFCAPERLDELRNRQQKQKLPTRYDRKCYSLKFTESEKRVADGESFVIRLAMPSKSRPIFFNDIVREKVEFQTGDIDDQILIKSDGWPTYHLASVVDDHLMKINPIIRGEEWISSTPKQLLLYEALDWEPPDFAHLPLILGADRSKLSKRHGDVSALSFRDLGYLPDALINFLALMGWNPKNDKEIFSRVDLLANFKLTDVRKSGAIFNAQKLDWLNSQYIKNLSDEKLVNEILPFLERDGLLKKVGNNYQNNQAKIITLSFLKKASSAIKDRLSKLTEASEHLKIFLSEPSYEASLLVWKSSTPKDTKIRLNWLLEALNGIPESEFEIEKLGLELKSRIKTENQGVGDTLWPLRVALSGEKNSPDPFTLASVFGKKETLSRLNLALQKISKP